MHIIDPFGNEKEYTPEKIIDSVMRSGFSRQDAETIEEKVRERVRDGMETKDLYTIVYEEMLDVDESYALRYRLREAIGSLKPQHHEFEQYMTKVLTANGFDASWSPRPLPQGACSEHEIDILAKRDGSTYAVECKHHYHYHRLTGMSVVMNQWATLDDLQNGYEQGMTNAVDVDKGWVIVNTKLSRHAKQYAECKGIRVTAWNYPAGEGLREIVERHRTYPITILRIPSESRRMLSENGVLTVQELLSMSDDDQTDVGLPNTTIHELQHKARRILEKE